MNTLDDNCKQTIFLDEIFDRLKCMDETNSMTTMLDENNMYMDESYKMDEIFDRLKCMDETNSMTTMLDENNMYMDESYKMDEIFG